MRGEATEQIGRRNDLESFTLFIDTQGHALLLASNHDCVEFWKPLKQADACLKAPVTLELLVNACPNAKYRAKSLFKSQARFSPSARINPKYPDTFSLRIIRFQLLQGFACLIDHPDIKIGFLNDTKWTSFREIAGKVIPVTPRFEFYGISRRLPIHKCVSRFVIRPSNHLYGQPQSRGEEFMKSFKTWVRAHRGTPFLAWSTQRVKVSTAIYPSSHSIKQ